MRVRSSLLLLALLAACSDGPTDPDGDSARSRSDRPDAAQGAQVHVVYALPSDGLDQGLDTTGALESTVGSFQLWLASKAGGRRLHLDVQRDGALDVTFVRLSRTDAQIAAFGLFQRDSIERELARAGLIRANKLYAVYYDGGSTTACGGAAWPPSVAGQSAAMYLKGSAGSVSCVRPLAATPTAFPGYWEFAMLHDLLHTMGIVSANAPHHTSAFPAHVPERNDLMYSGTEPWMIDQTTLIDVGGDDYFGAAVPPGVTKLSDSAYLTAGPAAAPPSAAAGQPSRDPPSVAVEGLPFHPPFPEPAGR